MAGACFLRIAARTLQVAMGILKTICTIVSIFVDNPQKLADIESQIYPAIDLILQGDHQDCLEDAIDVLVTISFVRKSISPQLWTYFPILYNLFSGEYFDYFDGVLCSMRRSIEWKVRRSCGPSPGEL
jgi:hypothetical protein